jgi:octaprenyl-diphosphate synthase
MYDQMIAGKTAAAIAGALTAGAALAGGNEMLLEALSRYGEHVGRAFQIRDDLLDFADISINGCSMDRRPALPLIHAFQHSDDVGQSLVRQSLDGQEVDGSQVTKLLQTTGSLAYAEAVADSLADKAVQLARAIPQVNEVLEALARYVVIRHR